MARILMTGMCSTLDRTVYYSDAAGVRCRPFSPVVKTYAEVIAQFKIAANTGNYLISEGAYRAFEGHDVEYIPFWHLLSKAADENAMKAIRETYDFCLFTTANILNRELDLTNESKVLEAIAMPTIFMSIGVQSRSVLSCLSAPSLRFIERL